MELKVLGSSSSGNCYILDNGKEALIIEAGIVISKIKQALDFDLRKVAGCIVTHAHNDHAKYIHKIVELGIPTLAIPDVWTAKGVTGSRAISIKPYKGYKLGRFKVLPFPAAHDVPCVGYHIMHPDCGNLLFLTDSCDCLQIFSGLSHILIECNYSMPKLIEAVNSGRTQKQQIDRLPNSHMELDTCKRVINQHDLTKVQEIVLLHLSDNNSDKAHFISEIERVSGRMVYIAKPGLTIDITKM